MKKKYLLLLAVCLLLATCFLLTACSLFAKKSETAPALADDSIRTVYTAYAEGGGTLSYEEWLASVKGEAGVGIEKIEKGPTVGLVDTYTITLTNGTTFNFTVTNGKDGENGKDGKDGVNADGTSADPDAPTPDEYFRFTLLEDDTYEISARYNDMPLRVVIPSAYNGKPVTSIANRAFETHEQLKSCTDEFIIPNSVTTIGDEAFSHCRNMTSITIPDSVMTIGSSAFSHCTALTEIRYDGDLASWCAIPGLRAIMDSNGEISLYIGGVKVENEQIIPEGVTGIGSYAFAHCSALTSVSIPESVISIGYKAFAYCEKLTTILYQGTIDQWKAIEKEFDYDFMVGRVTSWDYNMEDYTVTCTDGNFSPRQFAAQSSIEGMYEQWGNMELAGFITDTKTMFDVVKSIFPDDYRSFSASANIWKTALKDISDDITIYFHAASRSKYYGQIKLLKQFGGLQVITDADGNELWITETAPTDTTPCPSW